MAKNFIHDGRRLVMTAPAGGVTSGGFAMIGAVFGIALTSAAAGAQFTLAVGGVWTLPKGSGAITAGAAVYWDAAAKAVTTTVGSNQKIGVAEQAALTADTALPIRLNDNF